jgi:diadenosine tetraphosphate (Ap4A) HIT family hydrolase
MSDGGCTFCAIIERVESAVIVYENHHTVVFMDQHPINVGHVLVIPKTHIESFYELAENDFVELMLVVRRVCQDSLGQKDSCLESHSARSSL